MVEIKSSEQVMFDLTWQLITLSPWSGPLGQIQFPPSERRKSAYCIPINCSQLMSLMG